MIPMKLKLFAVTILIWTLAVLVGENANADAANATGCQPEVTVTNVADSGAGTLRQAILDVCDGGMIAFNLNLPDVITLTSGELVIDKAVSINGPGAQLLTINGNHSSRILHTSGSSVEIDRVALRYGFAPGDGGGGILNTGTLTVTRSLLSQNGASYGGAIVNSGVLVVVDSIFLDNPAILRGGAIGNGGVVTLTGSQLLGNSAGTGGAIYNDGGGAITINDSALVGNTASSWGGAIANENSTITVNNSHLDYNAAGWRAGGIANLFGSTLTLNYSTLSKSVASDEWGFGGGIYNYESTVILNHSLLSNNTVASGGGIYSYDGTLTIENSTLSGNVAIAHGGGIFLDYSNDVILRDSTIADNVAADADSISIFHVAVSLTIANSIIVSADQGANCEGSNFTSLGYNLSDDASCNLTQATDMTNTDPLLGPLADNGGATFTHALLPGSPAIDSGDSANCPATDQRGVSRPQGVGCDRGAVEAVDIAWRWDYTYVMIDGNAGQGRYTLFVDGSFVDEASGGGSWGTPALDKLWLVYDAGYACDALLLGSLLPTNQVRGLRLCRDGSGTRGVWQADIGE